MEASEVLRRAADYIDEHGWIRGDFGYRGGPVCAVGAINAVTAPPTGERVIITGIDHFPSHGDRFNAVRKLYDHLGLDTPWHDGFGIGNAVAQWNDASGTTALEVTAAMRAAADG